MEYDCIISNISYEIVKFLKVVGVDIHIECTNYWRVLMARRRADALSQLTIPQEIESE